ncbi:MAG: hypothetical protein HFP81_09915 [Methylococcales symbiont of Hymedesmia sp. n. MRB-2018]|nr:MAG: hypothetical protein HFP81_09915 [Methylococcales symbiont of Hymedesmia sp. n. MRB-2018]
MGLFDRFNKKPVEARVLEHPADLQLGDMLDFALMDQAILNNQSFQVAKIWTLDLGGDNHKRTYFQLNDVGKNIRLRVCQDDVLELAKEVTPDALLKIFSEADIVAILDPDTGVNHQLKANISMQKLSTELIGWVAQNYRQEGFELAYRYEGDYRHKSLPDWAGDAERGCDFAWLISDDRQYALEFRVFDGGRTEAHLCAYVPLRKIDALWPAKQNSG